MDINKGETVLSTVGHPGDMLLGPGVSPPDYGGFHKLGVHFLRVLVNIPLPSWGLYWGPGQDIPSRGRNRCTTSKIGYPRIANSLRLPKA